MEQLGSHEPNDKGVNLQAPFPHIQMEKIRYGEI